MGPLEILVVVIILVACFKIIKGLPEHHRNPLIVRYGWAAAAILGTFLYFRHVVLPTESTDDKARAALNRIQLRFEPANAAHAERLRHLLAKIDSTYTKKDLKEIERLARELEAAHRRSRDLQPIRVFASQAKATEPIAAGTTFASAVLSNNTDDDRPSWLVTGRGLDSRDAEQEALRKAQGEVIAYLRGQDPPLEWMPPLDYVDKNLVKKRSAEPQTLPEPVGQVIKVTLQVEITPESRADILRYERQNTVEGRQLWLAKFIGGIVVILGLVTGLVRLQEWSKGYFPIWLLMGGLVAVGLTVMFLLA